jgi:hypothetical protein
VVLEGDAGCRRSLGFDLIADPKRLQNGKTVRRQVEKRPRRVVGLRPAFKDRHRHTQPLEKHREHGTGDAGADDQCLRLRYLLHDSTLN